MKHLYIFTTCACKKLKRVYFLFILSVLFGGTIAAQGSWTESTKTLTITNFTTGTLQTVMSGVLTSESKTLSDIEILSISTSSGNTLNATDLSYLQGVKTSLQRLLLTGFSAIPDNAFKDFTGLSAVSLSGVVSVGESAFEGCFFLSALNNVGTITTIKDRAFYGCTRLRTGVNSLINLSTIGNFAFFGCTSITSINLTNVTSLGTSAFENCTSLEEVNFPSNIPNPLGNNAFSSNALDLTSDIPSWVATILASSNNVFLDQRPKVNILLTPPDRAVLLNADFNLIKPTVRIETLKGNAYRDIINQSPSPNWLATGLTEPVPKIFYLNIERNESWFQNNLLNSSGTRNLTYHILQGIISIDNTDFRLAVSNFVTCDGASTRATTTELTITFPGAVDNFSASQITLSSGTAPSGSATVGTPVKVGDGTVWTVPVTNVVEGNVLVTISSSAYLGGGSEEIFLSQGPTLWFDLQGGNMPASETANLVFENDKWGKFVTFEQFVGALPTPTLSGYRFDGWYSLPFDNTSFRYHSGTQYQRSGDFTVYAYWVARNYEITFNSNGGDAVTPPSKTVTYNAAIGSLPVPTRTGYTFTEWTTSLDENLATIYTEDTIYKIDGDTTLFAQWEANYYLLKFNTNDETDTYLDSKKVKFDSIIGELPVPTRSGYIFIVWNTKSDGEGETFNGNMTYQFAKDTTLYAIWEAKNNLKINFDPNGGILSRADSSKIVTYDAAIGTMPTPTLAGHRFTGWNTVQNGTGATYTAATIYTIDGDTTLFAQWEVRNDLTINFDPNGGTLAAADSSKTVTYDAAIGTMPIPTLFGYQFTEWNTLQNGTGETYTEETIYRIDGDITLYAQWEADKYNITFNPNQGTVTPTVKPVDYNAAIGTLPVPVRSGYAFTQWNTLQDGTGDVFTAETIYQWTTDTTLYAQWRKLSENTNISDINVNNGERTIYGENASLAFLMECGENTITVTVSTEDASTKVIYKGEEIDGNSFDITFEKYGVIPITITAKAEAGNTKDTTFYIIRRFPFEQVVITRWDNTMTIINNPLNNGDFRFNTYRWYEFPNDALPISNQQFYSAGSNGQSLNGNKEYYVVLTADEFEGEISTCLGKPAMKPQSTTTMYPNPVKSNAMITIEAEENTDIEIYNVSGTLLKREKQIGNINTFNLPYPAGVYLIKVNGQTTTIIVE